MADAEPEGHPIDVTLLVQISPLYKHESTGDRVPFSSDLQRFAESLTHYLVDNLGKFSEPRFADMYLACVVKRGDETASQEYRSGHYLEKKEASNGASGS